MRFWPLLSLGLWGCLSYNGFVNKKNDKICETLEACNPSIPCDPPDPLPEADCEFDPKAAHDCLDGVYTCDTTNPGFEYVVEPQICLSVCGDAQ
jgi:hypothetical protein